MEWNDMDVSTTSARRGSPDGEMKERKEPIEKIFGLYRLPKVCAFIWKVGARFPNNGLGLESPATIQYERTFGNRSI
jgi:hypothetical protein